MLLVDDGIATGASMYAAMRALRERRPAALVLAVPVAPASACAWLRREVEELVCLYAPAEFLRWGSSMGTLRRWRTRRWWGCCGGRDWRDRGRERPIFATMKLSSKMGTRLRMGSFAVASRQRRNTGVSPLRGGR